MLEASVGLFIILAFVFTVGILSGPPKKRVRSREHFDLAVGSYGTSSNVNDLLSTSATLPAATRQASAGILPRVDVKLTPAEEAALKGK